MRYSLAGGYQYSNENVSGYPYCFAGNQYAQIPSVKDEIKDLTTRLIQSQAHRNNILSPFHQKVNIGIWWTPWMMHLVQQFEHNFVELLEYPSITDGVLTVAR